MNNELPFLIINMASEMVYIIEQRLEAQSVEKDKADRVLKDLINAAFSTDFLDDLFVPQPLYDTNAIKSIFIRIAHSSIMKLNSDSMDRLLDLMFMTFKFQLSRMLSPRDIFAVTRRHLNDMMDIASRTGISDRVEDVQNRLMAFQSQTSPWRMCMIRKNLLNYLVKHKARVSLLLVGELQLNSGYFVIPSTDHRHDTCRSPGTIKIMGQGKSVIFDPQMKLNNPFVNSHDCRYCDGRNLYKNRPTPLNQNGISNAKPNTQNTHNNNLNVGGFNDLAKSLGGNNSGNVVLNLSNTVVEASEVEEIVNESIGTVGEQSKHFAKLLSSFDVETEEKDQDLLDLMDAL
ncbi:hypothetical protein P9112_006093 [Eukaryota sp. TZLM1-RC]